VIPTFFEELGRHGDFAWMRMQPDHASTLFIFNDNEEQFNAYLNGMASGFTAGAGNAIARPWRLLSPPQSAGIPTGKKGKGYASLDAQTKTTIDQSLQVIKDLITTGNYSQMVFSADSTLTTLGKATFEVSAEVCEYIFKNVINFGSIQLKSKYEEGKHHE
jgi:hypothetical protein